MPGCNTEAWERQKGESTKAFEAFSIYRDMGADRSLRQVAAQLGKSRALIERWSRQWEWVERARNYDNDIEKKAHTKAVKAVSDMRARHIKIAMQLQTKALTELQNLPQGAMTAREILSFITEAAKMECENREIEAGTPKGVQPKEKPESTESAVKIYIPDNGRDESEGGEDSHDDDDSSTDDD